MVHLSFSLTVQKRVCVLSQQQKKKSQSLTSQQALKLEDFRIDRKTQMMTALFLNVLKSWSDMSGQINLIMVWLLDLIRLIKHAWVGGISIFSKLKKDKKNQKLPVDSHVQ